MSISIKLSFLATDTYKKVHKETTYLATKKIIMDTIACALAGHNAPGIHILKQQMLDWGGKGEAQVFFSNEAIPAPNSAFINSAMIHAIDYDDVHPEANLHIMSTVFPVAFSIGQMMGSSGMQILNSIIAGVEVAARLGRIYIKNQSHTGFLTATIIGGFGATVTASLLMNADEEKIANAMGIYYSQTSGNRQALVDFTLTKRIQPAFTARSAIWSAMLAQKGITGAEKTFEGVFGLFKLYTKGIIPKENEFIEERQFMEIEKLRIKSFPTCGCHHRSILAALELSSKNNLKYEDIDYVEIFLPPDAIELVGNPFVMNDNPQVSAQFSAAYGVALALIRGHVKINDIANEQIKKDTETASLAKKTKIHEIKGTQIVKIKLKDGRVLEKEWASDEYFMPISEEFDDIINKFNECAEYSKICSKEFSEKIIENVLKFEKINNISNFIRDCLVFNKFSL